MPEIDSLFKSLHGNSVHARTDSLYQQYRRLWNENPRLFRVADFPLSLDIETVAVCNLRCKFCRTTYNRYPNTKFDFDLLKRVISEGSAKGLYAVKFNWRGEPLLHPDLVKMVAFAKKAGIIDVFFNTNAQLLTKNISIELIRSGLDRIAISVEGYTKEVYESYRRGAKFDLLLKNIYGLINQREKLGFNKPKIRIQSVVIPELIQHEKEYIDFWKPYSDEITSLKLKEEKNYFLNEGIMDHEWSCPQPWQRMIIACNGEVLPCNEDESCIMVLGNAYKDSIQDLWNCVKENKIRRFHQKGKSYELEACRRCPLRASEIKHNK